MKTYLDWSSYHESGMGDAYADIPRHGGDFAKAVAVCINSRQCESIGKGVMCPSYRATEDPVLSTGGRVQMLKKALNSEDVESALDDPELARAMALCVSCKGCKRECENEVDMAQIKLEYMAHKNAIHGTSWRTRLFAHLPRWLHRLPWLKGLVTLRNRSRFLSLAAERLLGVRADRPLPESVDAPFDYPTSEFSEAEPIADVVLFVDTFSHYYEPKIAKSAIKVLETAGYRVHIAEPDSASDEPERPLCCGRTYLAHGLIDQARDEASRSLKVLAPYAEAGYPIIGLEPACLLALRDDNRSLGLDPMADEVASRAILFEEFIAREITAKRWALDLTATAQYDSPLLIHGHCHQKAVGAMKSMRKVLKRIKGLRYEFIDSSCCGGAGSFYLEREHAQVADKMATADLLPQLQANPEAELIANGFACRRQIRDGSHHQPQHLAVLLAGMLETDGVGGANI